MLCKFYNILLLQGFNKRTKTINGGIYLFVEFVTME